MASLLVMIRQDILHIADGWDKVSRKPHKDRSQAAKGNQQPHPSAGASAEQNTKYYRQAGLGLHGRFKHEIRQGTSDDWRNRVGEPGDQAPRRKDSPLNIRSDLGLPDSLI